MNMADREIECHRLIKELKKESSNNNNNYCALVSMVGRTTLDKKIFKALFYKEPNHACSILINMLTTKLHDKAFKVIFTKYYPIIFKFMESQHINNNKIPTDIAENLSQEVLIKINNLKDGIKTNCEGYIYRICRNTFLDYSKRKSTKQDTVTTGIEIESNDDKNGNTIHYEDIECTIHQESWWECFDIILKIMKKDDPEIIELCYLTIKGFKPKEIKGKIGGLTKEITKKIYTIRKQLKLLVDEHCQEQIL